MSLTDLTHLVTQWTRNKLGSVEESQIEIDWHRLHETPSDTDFYPDQQPRFGQQFPDTSQVVFTSNYENKTDFVQAHTFVIERTTEAIVKVKVTKGYAKTGGTGITIGVPENVRNLTGSFGSGIDICSMDENTVKHSVKWQLNSTVNAHPHSRTTAKMIIKEKEYRCSFVTNVTLRGKVIVRIKDGTDRVLEGNIASILRNLQDQHSFNGNGVATIHDRKVSWQMQGSLVFKFGISQDTSVSSQIIQDTPDYI